MRRSRRIQRIRRATFAAVVLFIFAATTRDVGEGDRSEKRAIGTMRAIVTAQSSYRRATGYYDTLECVAGAACAPGVTGTFLEPDIATRGDRYGYRVEFHAGPRAKGDAGKPISATAMSRFAVVAVPVASSRFGRSYCVDDSGDIYVTKGRGVPHVQAGRCLDTTLKLNAIQR